MSDPITQKLKSLSEKITGEQTTFSISTPFQQNIFFISLISGHLFLNLPLFSHSNNSYIDNANFIPYLIKFINEMGKEYSSFVPVQESVLDTILFEKIISILDFFLETPYPRSTEYILINQDVSILCKMRKDVNQKIPSLCLEEQMILYEKLYELHVFKYHEGIMIETNSSSNFVPLDPDLSYYDYFRFLKQHFKNITSCKDILGHYFIRGSHDIQHSEYYNEKLEYAVICRIVDLFPVKSTDKSYLAIALKNCSIKYEHSEYYHFDEYVDEGYILFYGKTFEFKVLVQPKKFSYVGFFEKMLDNYTSGCLQQLCEGIVPLDIEYLVIYELFCLLQILEKSFSPETEFSI